MLKKTALFLLFVFIIQAVLIIPAAATTGFRDLAAKSAILAERENGIILYENNATLRHPADSLTKIMTLLLAVYAIESDEISDNEIITMTEAAWHDMTEDSPTLDIYPGEEMTFIDLMYSAYVGNANEACNMLALRISGNITSFVTLMNNTAREIGAENTRFMNPHGEYHDSQYTTARDLLLIFSEALNSPLFMEISGTFRHITESTEEFESRTMTSSNALINPSSRYYNRYCLSGRDSGTYEGGHSAVSYAEEDGLSLISIILGSDVHILEDESAEMRNFTETLRMYQWGFSQFSWRDILKTTDLLARVEVLHGSGADFVNARPAESLSLLLDNSIPIEEFERRITIFSARRNEPLVAPINAGDVLGEVVITRDGEEIARVDLVANTSINLSGVEYIRGQVSDLLATNTARNVIIVLAALLILYIVLVVRYNIVRANRLRRIKNAKNDIIRERHQNFRD